MPVYSGNGNVIKLGTDNAVDLTEPVGGNTRLMSVNPQGIMVEQTLATSSLAVHIVDQNTGLDKGVADIVGSPGSLHAVFRAPIVGTYPVEEGLGNISFNFDNTILGCTGMGFITLILDGSGNVTASSSQL